MARPRKIPNYQQEIQVIDQKIQALKEKRALLLQEQEKVQMGQLLSIMREKNLTPSQLLDAVQNQPEQE